MHPLQQHQPYHLTRHFGDTELLDHLLKHVANEVNPGGSLRFRRSHNASGMMEYWHEDADILKIRKETDEPFWTPPPGWKPGDSPSRCQRTWYISELKDTKKIAEKMKKNE